MSKLIYAKSKAGFNLAYADKSPIHKSIVFMEDGYLWTHGNFFRLFSGETPFTSSVNNNIVSLKDSAGNDIVSFNVGVTAVNGTSPISASTVNGVVTITHENPFTVNQIVGPGANGTTTIIIPQITFDKFGHYVSKVDRTATLNQVSQTNVDTDGTTKYLVFSSTSTTNTSQVLEKTSKITYVPSTGTLTVPVLVEGTKRLSELYAPLSHVDVVGNATTSGHLKLSDAIDSTLGLTGETAATPAAVKAVYDYAKNIIASGDAMIFKGVIGANGIITGTADVNGKTLATLDDYFPGWTFKAGTAQTIAGLGALEIGDMVLVISKKVTSYKVTDFTVIQTNIDGAVTAGTNLLVDQLVVGTGSTGLKTLAAGVDGQFLMIQGGKPAWVTSSSTYRAVSVNGTKVINNSELNDLILKAGTGVSLTWNAANKDITIATTLQNLDIQNSGANLGSYNPTATTNNKINFGTGLTATLASNTFTVNHSNSVTAQATQAVRSFSYDANGHITGSSVVTSLPTPNNITFSDAKSTATTKTFNGSTPLTVKFLPATGDINITASIATANTIEYTLGLTHRYRPISYVPAFNGTVSAILNDTSNAALVLAPGNDNVSIKWEANQLKISSLNTWRNISAYKLTNNTLSEVLSSTVGGADLQFGSEFLWDETKAGDPELKLAWAEISATGVITYAV